MLNLPKNEYRISITSGCNMKCVYCHNEGNHVYSELSIDDIENLIKNSYDLGLDSIRITGGEPLTHKDIINICEMLSEKYGLKVGINTNLIEIEKLMYMVNRGYIHRVVVGLDYFDGDISKNSPVGVSSERILSNILEVRDAGVDVSVSTVFNGDYDNLYNLINWCLENGIRIKILEEVTDEIADSSSPEYINMRNSVINDFNLTKEYDPIYNEWHGSYEGKKVVSFFHSHCRVNDCEVCKNMHLRVTSTGKFKQCIQTSEYDVDIFDGDIRENILKTLENPIAETIKNKRQRLYLSVNSK